MIPWEPVDAWQDPSLPENLPPGFDPFQEGNFYDPYNVFLSTVPVLEEARDKMLRQSMAEAGFTGNRYSTDAMRRAGEVGGEVTLAMQNELNKLLYGQAQGDLSRMLQAAGMGSQLGMNLDQMQQNRLGALSGFGTYEQGRWDDIARMLFGDFRANQYGLLPNLLGTSIPQGIPFQEVDPGQYGFLNTLADLGRAATSSYASVAGAP